MGNYFRGFSTETFEKNVSAVAVGIQSSQNSERNAGL